MKGNQIRQRLRSGERVYGRLPAARETTEPERMERDFTLFDHPLAFFDHRLADQARSLKTRGVAPVVRLPVPDSRYVTLALEAGMDGVLLSGMETAATVNAACNAARYHPLQGRALRALNAGEPALGDETLSMLEARNADRLVLLRLETIEGQEQLGEWLRAADLDAVLIDVERLSLALEHPGRPEHPEVLEALRALIACTRAAECGVGLLHAALEDRVMLELIGCGLNCLLDPAPRALDGAGA